MRSILLLGLALLAPADPGTAASVEETLLDDVHPTVHSRLEEVVVYPAMAIVHRTARIPEGGGRFAVVGLPRGIEEASVRVRAEGGEVAGFEGRDRLVPPEPDTERLREIEQAMHALEREIERADDEVALLATFESRLAKLFELDRDVLERDEADPRPSAEIWAENHGYLTERMAETRRAWRTAKHAREDLAERRRRLERERARLEPGDGQRVRELLVDVVPRGSGELTLDVEYRVDTAGWKPDYELRLAGDLRGAELVYRAQVWQASGESWDGARVVLSTGRPLRSGKPPAPAAGTMRLVPPGEEVPEPKLFAPGAPGVPPVAAAADPQAAGGAAFATPSVEGLVLRFEMAGAQRIPSRQRPTAVLVGRAELELEAEHYAVPAVDRTAWLHARVRNTSPWILLPGQCVTYFGEELVGSQPVATVPGGGWIAVQLGRDPGLVVERLHTAHAVRRAGFIGNRDEVTDAWLLRATSRGACSSRPDGSTKLVLREALPRADDARLAIELDGTTPATAPGPVWENDRKQNGILTWILEVPADGTSEARYSTLTSYPSGHGVTLD